MSAGEGAAYWSDPAHHGWDELWMNHPSVRAAINRRVTGDPRKWPIAWLRDLVPDRLPFARAVSIGSGLGNFERTLVHLDIARSITGVEESREMVRRSRQSASEEGLGERIAYVAADAQEFLENARDCDAVFFHESLHHFARPPETLGLVRRALRPRGVLYLDEYAGPSRDEWGWRDLLAWNAVYWRLPSVLRRTKIVRWPINRTDPTEAIASSRILPGVAEHFRVLSRRDYGGNLLAPIYPSLRRPDQPGGPGAVEFDRAVESILAREDALLRRRGGYYTVVVAEPKEIPSLSRSRN